jgi:hypothetical protein
VQPYEVICAPYVVYVAPVGSSFPNLDTSFGAGGFTSAQNSPPAPWTTIGTAGNKSYIDTGVTVSHPQTIGTFVPGGSTAIRKAWRQTEELTVAFSIADLSPTQYSFMINNATVVTQAATGGAPGDQHFEMLRGVLINSFSLLVRGVSPFQEAYFAQYEIGAAYNAGNAAPVFSKQGPAVLAVEWHAYELTVGTLATFRAANTP